MEAFGLFDPDLLELIRENRELLCGLTLFSDKDKLIEEFTSKAKKISENYEILPYLFPRLQKNTFGTWYPTGNVHEHKSRGRICFEDHFDFYFAGYLTKNSISKEKVLEIVSATNENDIAEYFKALNNKTYSTFLQYLYGFSHEKRYLDVLTNFIPLLLPIHGNFKDLTKFLGASNYIWICGVIEKICENLTSKAIITYLQKIFTTCTNYEILIDIIYYFARSTDFYFKKKKMLSLLFRKPIFSNYTTF